MSAIKIYIEELAEKLGIDFNKVTEEHMINDINKNTDNTSEMVHYCKCNMCGSLLIDTNPQIDAKLYPYRDVPSTESMTDDEGGLIGCPICKTDAYLSDDISSFGL